MAVTPSLVKLRWSVCTRSSGQPPVVPERVDHFPLGGLAGGLDGAGGRGCEGAGEVASERAARARNLPSTMMCSRTIRRSLETARDEAKYPRSSSKPRSPPGPRDGDGGSSIRSWSHRMTSTRAPGGSRRSAPGFGGNGDGSVARPDGDPGFRMADGVTDAAGSSFPLVRRFASYVRRQVMPGVVRTHAQARTALGRRTGKGR